MVITDAQLAGSQIDKTTIREVLHMNTMVRRGLLVPLALALGACAYTPMAQRCTGAADNPQRHFSAAMKDIDAGHLEEAGQQLDRALFCDPQYAPASAALALLQTHLLVRQSDLAYQEVDAQRVLDVLHRSKRYSETPEERFIFHVTALRIASLLQQELWLDEGETWLEHSERHFRQARRLEVDETQLPYYEQSEAALYFMSEAYFRAAHRLEEARNMLRQVLDARHDGHWYAKADAMLKQVAEVERALAGATISDAGREIALQRRVSRADLAALLVDELKLEELFANGLSRAGESVRSRRGRPSPADIARHPFQPAISAVLKFNIRGLSLKLDQDTRSYLFQPSLPVTRKELAFVLEDVLIRLTGNQGLATDFYGSARSPFPDVRSNVAWFNAVMTAVTRGLMQTEVSGEFRPDALANGAEVLLALRGLQQRPNRSSSSLVR